MQNRAIELEGPVWPARLERTDIERWLPVDYAQPPVVFSPVRTLSKHSYQVRHSVVDVAQYIEHRLALVRSATVLRSQRADARTQ